MIKEREFFAGVIHMHVVRGLPARCITVEHVLQWVNAMTRFQIDATLHKVDRPNCRKTKKRCRQLHKVLWKEHKYG